MHEKMITNASGMGTAMFKVLNSSPDTRNYPVSHGAFAYMNLPRNMFGGIGAGAWDYKPEIRELSPVRDWQQVDDSIYRFDVWTNIHFGYVGSAAGFSEEELLHGAGVAQAIARNSNPDRQPWNPKTWDDPFDQAAIRLGVKLWHDYGLKLQPADIVKAIRVTPGLARLPVTIW